jgi:surface antigen
MLEVLMNPVFIVFASLTITAVVSTIAVQWRKVRQAEVEASLKQDMIQRGLSADDIQKVLGASARRCRPGDTRHKAILEASLIEQMVKAGMSADDIQKVLEASRGASETAPPKRAADPVGWQR